MSLSELLREDLNCPFWVEHSVDNWRFFLYNNPVKQDLPSEGN